jgi:hypothetical protein
MLPRTTAFLAIALLLTLCSTGRAAAQATFSTIPSVHFDVKYIQGVTEGEARRILGFLQADYDTLRSQLGMDGKEKLEVRLHDSPGRFRSEVNAGAETYSAMYVRGTMYVLTTVQASGLEKAMRYQLARVFLEPAGQRACPAWLREAFAVNHAEIIADLSPPGSVALASFSDLTQDIAEAATPTDRNDVNFVLGRTMQFFIERYGKQKAFGLFKEFDGTQPTETVFKKSLGEDLQTIEKAWSKYVAIKPRKGK